MQAQLRAAPLTLATVALAYLDRVRRIGHAPAGLRKWRILEFRWGARSADDRRMVQLPMKPRLRARLRYFIVVSLVMLTLSVVIWGAVYLLTLRPL